MRSRDQISSSEYTTLSSELFYTWIAQLNCQAIALKPTAILQMSEQAESLDLTDNMQSCRPHETLMTTHGYTKSANACLPPDQNECVAERNDRGRRWVCIMTADATVLDSIPPRMGSRRAHYRHKDGVQLLK